MRPMLGADLDRAVCCLLAVPRPLWPEQATRLIAAAQVADRYRKRTRQPHPQFGNGSVIDAAQRFPAVPLPRPGDPAYYHALAEFLRVYLSLRGHHKS